MAWLFVLVAGYRVAVKMVDAMEWNIAEHEIIVAASQGIHNH